jgi:hypothetical protein
MRRRLEAARAVHPESTAMSACLYCEREDREFKGNEHVVPESLGNNNLILPKGVVCDQCNNGVLSQLDNHLVNFPLFGVMRNIYDIKSKSTGRVPEARYADVHLSQLDEKNIKIRVLRKQSYSRTEHGFNFTITPKRYRRRDRKKLARCLFKIAIGLIYIDHGEMAWSKRFRPIKRMILGEIDFNGYILLVRTGNPEPICKFTYDFVEVANQPTVFFRASFFGITFLTDLERRILDNFEANEAEVRDRFNIMEF